MTLASIISISICAAFFGGSFIYFVRVIDQNSNKKITSVNIVISFLGNLKNIINFYKTFINCHDEKGKSIAFCILFLHLVSPVIFWVIVISSAIKSGDLSFY